MKKISKHLKYFDYDAIAEIVESLDNNVCSHKYDLKHRTEGHMRGDEYCGGDIWEVYCVRCNIIKKSYSVSIHNEVDWVIIEKMKEVVRNS